MCAAGGDKAAFGGGDFDEFYEKIDDNVELKMRGNTMVAINTNVWKKYTIDLTLKGDGIKGVGEKTVVIMPVGVGVGALTVPSETVVDEFSKDAGNTQEIPRLMSPQSYPDEDFEPEDDEYAWLACATSCQASAHL